MDLKQEKLFVTGADGFIGSHLAETLVRMGCSVRAFVCYNSFNSWGWLDHSEPEIKSNMEIVAGDIRDPHGVHKAMEGCSVVFHLAALIAIPFSYRSPDAYVETNVKGTLNVVQAAKELGVKKVVHTSTSEVYGTAQFVPIVEEHPLQAQSPYSATKIAADQVAMSFYYSFQTPVSIIRPFNTYGPRQSARAVIPTIIIQLATGQKSIRLGSLLPTRDFSYIEDTVGGFIKIAESELSVGEVINIGSNFEISIGDVAGLIAELMGVELTIESDDQRLRPDGSEVQRLWASNAKARKLTGWEPRYGGLNGFREGILKTIEWYRNHFNLQMYKPEIYNL